MDYPIADAHHHYWDLGRGGYQWLKDHIRHMNGEPVESDMAPILGQMDNLVRNFLPPDLIREGQTLPAGYTLAKSVCIETQGDTVTPWLETLWLQALSDRYGLADGIIGYADLLDDNLSEVLQKHRAAANFRGIRLFCLRDDSALYNEKIDTGIDLLTQQEWVLDVDLDWTQAPVFQELFIRHPHQLFIIGHAGFPKYRSPRYFDYWRRAMSQIAAHNNVVCKISGLGMSDHCWSLDSIRPYIQHCLEVFGVERCMFASNWPVDSLYSSYHDLWQAYGTLTENLSCDERHRLFYRNCEKYYRI
ncbi:amidohydrolase family protein [Sodalis sp. dw_96]|uniref:amidohydrolase family protein n=1 Tax=Sodalis sp. dw_96 TaxID=2719794 RepID=UPI001BD48518|nr:amidohydrolase family protein [Sodalis sp. dw_96]